jgi:acyl-coenzyme A thioesterase PaaI-like protein
MGLSLAAAMGGEARVVTTALALDYLDGATPGQWVEIAPRVVKAGKASGVVDALIHADGVLIARANACFRAHA